MRHLACKWIPTHPNSLRLMPGADAFEAQPEGGRGVESDGVKDQPCEGVGALLDLEFGVGGFHACLPNLSAQIAALRLSRFDFAIFFSSLR